ncbi:unnamed protein product [Prunus armeniaca]
MRHARFRVVTKEERFRNKKDVLGIFIFVTVATVPLQYRVLFISLLPLVRRQHPPIAVTIHPPTLWVATVTTGHRFGWYRSQKNRATSLLPSRPISAPEAAGHRRKQLENSRFLTELSSSRSPLSGHQIGRVRYGFLAIFHALAAG